MKRVKKLNSFLNEKLGKMVLNNIKGGTENSTSGSSGGALDGAGGLDGDSSTFY